MVMRDVRYEFSMAISDLLERLLRSRKARPAKATENAVRHARASAPNAQHRADCGLVDVAGPQEQPPRGIVTMRRVMASSGNVSRQCPRRTSRQRPRSVVDEGRRPRKVGGPVDPPRSLTTDPMGALA